MAGDEREIQVIIFPSLPAHSLTHKQRIAGLSYMGDYRIENPNKVGNIVSMNHEQFSKLYTEVFKVRVKDMQ